MENDSLSKLTKLSKFTKYLIEIENELWHSFKLVALSQGLKIKDAIREAIIEYIKNHQTQETKIEVQIIKNIEARQDLLQFIIEEDIKHKLKEIIRASQNLKRNPQLKAYINDLKLKIIDDIRKHPSISKELAQQIKTVFQNLS